MVVVGVLIESDEGIGFIAGMENFARAEVNLENGGAARNRRGDGHIGHHILGGGASELGEKGADGLNAVLGMTGEADDRIADGSGSREFAHDCLVNAEKVAAVRLVLFSQMKRQKDHSLWE